jgi:hypothetical protein
MQRLGATGFYSHDAVQRALARMTAWAGHFQVDVRLLQVQIPKTRTNLKASKFLVLLVLLKGIRVLIFGSHQGKKPGPTEPNASEGDVRGNGNFKPLK